MNNLIKGLTLLTVMLFLAMGCSNNNQRTVYVDVVKVFNEFNLSKELRENAEKQSLDFSLTIDSLELVLNTSNSETENYRLNLNKYNELRMKEREYLDHLIADSDEKIWSVLNGYFKGFGMERGVSVMLGGNGSGSVLYVDDKLDLTMEFLEYANAKYEGE